MAEKKRIERLEQQLESLQYQLQREENSMNLLYNNSIKIDFVNVKKSFKTTRRKANLALNAKVCSESNRYYNEALDKQDEFEENLECLESEIISYQQKYLQAETTLSKMNKIEQQLDLEESKLTVISYENLQKAYEDDCSYQQELDKIIKEAKEYADDMYNTYYPLIVKIVTGEAGDAYYPSIDQYYIMNVIENRVKSKYYPDTVDGVIFQRGQYQPTWDGSWDKEPNDRTKANVKKYLRGEVETGMPENILYQAMFKQGSYVWEYVENGVEGGHYYCAY